MSYRYLDYLAQFQAGREPDEAALELSVATNILVFDPGSLSESAIHIIAKRIGVPFDTLQTSRDKYLDAQDEITSARTAPQRTALDPVVLRHQEISHRLSTIEMALDVVLKVLGKDCNDEGLRVLIELARAGLYGAQVHSQAPATPPDKLHQD